MRTRYPLLRALAGLDALIAVLALWGGVALIAGAWEFVLPVGWLTPLGLTSWVLPGIALVLLIGGSMTVAAVVSWRGYRHATEVSIVAGVVLLAWVAGQFALFGLRAPVQAITCVLAIAVIVLAVAAAVCRG
jgi:hypothetical protein